MKKYKVALNVDGIVQVTYTVYVVEVKGGENK